MPVAIYLSRPINPKKGTEGFATELMWAQTVTSLLGKSCLTALTESRGLCPGLTKEESSVIRFVTVAIAQIEKGHTIKVKATGPLLVFLYTSLREYFKVKLPSSTFVEITEAIKSRVSVSTLGLSNSSVATATGLFSPSRKADVYVAWMPRRFSSSSDGALTEKENVQFYQTMMTEAEECTNHVIFRQVLVPERERYYFMDGLPNLFNYWQSTFQSLSALERKGNQYSLVPLVPIRGTFYEFSFEKARTLLAASLQPDMKRSHRILVIKGDKSMAMGEQWILRSDVDAQMEGDTVESSIVMSRLVEQAKEQSITTMTTREMQPIHTSLPPQVTGEDVRKELQDLGGAAMFSLQLPDDD